MGVVSQLLPVVERHPQQVADWLSVRAGQPVRFDTLSTSWTQRGPLLRLQGVRIGPQGKVGIGQVEMLVAMYTGILPGHSLIELRLRGVALTVHRDSAGRWSVYGLPRDVEGDPLEVLRRLGELQVIGGRLSVDAPSSGVSTTLSQINLRVRVAGDRLRAGVHGWLDSARAPVTGVVDFDRVSGDGDVYVETLPNQLASWSSLLAGVMRGVHLRDGAGHVRVWAQLHRHHVEQVTVQGDLQGVRFEGGVLLDRQWCQGCFGRSYRCWCVGNVRGMGGGLWRLGCGWGNRGGCKSWMGWWSKEVRSIRSVHQML